MADPVFVGQRVLIEMIFRLDGVETDPTIVTCASRSPNGTQAVITYPYALLIQRSAGVYEASILVDTAGTWVFRASGVGVVDAVNEYTLSVQASGLGS